MNSEFIDIVPIFTFNRSIRTLIQYISDNQSSCEFVIVADEQSRPIGIINMSYLYRKISFGLQFDHVLESVCSHEFETVSIDAVFVNTDKLLRCPQIVVDNNSQCIGILNANKMLASYLNEKTDISNPSANAFLSGIDFGFFMASSTGKILSKNRAASRILNRVGISNLEDINDIVPNFKLDGEHRHYSICFDGIYLEIYSYPIKQNNTISNYAAFMMDVTNREVQKEELKRLKKQYNELNAIIDNCYDEIYVTDKNGKCILANKASERLLGQSRQELYEKKPTDFPPGLNLANQVLAEKRFLRTIQTTRTGQKILVVGTPLFNRSGEIEKVILNSRPLIDMIDLRVSSDNLKPDSFMNINQRIVDLALKSHKIVAESDSMKSVVSDITRISQEDTNILLYGETGTGKNVLAAIIHETSRRQEGKLIKLSCSALDEKTIDALLFGHTENEYKKSLLLHANNGTLFIDEISDFPYALQGKLLYAIENKEFVPNNGDEFVQSDFRLIAASNKDLLKLVNEGKFRADLYYRLNESLIQIPPLRNRLEDIPVLIQDFISSYNRETDSNITITIDALNALKDYSWPGNIRELENVVRELIAASNSQTITISDIYKIPDINSPAQTDLHDIVDRLNNESLDAIMDSIEESLIKAASINIKSSYLLAEKLGISQSTAVRKMQKYGIKLT